VRLANMSLNPYRIFAQKNKKKKKEKKKKKKKGKQEGPLVILCNLIFQIHWE
jgi:hypothetical protein